MPRKQRLSVPLFSALILICLSAVRASGQDTAAAAFHVAQPAPKSIFPLLLPYNRLIDAAGTAVRFGDPNYENHSLDIALIPGTPYAAVEDRYGIAVIDTERHTVNARYAFPDDRQRKTLMSTYCGIKVLREDGAIHIFWGASDDSGNLSSVLEASFVPGKIVILNTFPFPAVNCPMALPNDLTISTENGKKYLYVVLNGNNQLVKFNLATRKRIFTVETGVAPYGLCLARGRIFVSNWGGSVPVFETTRETAGVPYGRVYTDPVTGACSTGTVSVFNAATGVLINEIRVGLHPGAIVSRGNYVYIAEANSDEISVLHAESLKIAEKIPVALVTGPGKFIGDSPDALALSVDGKILYAACGLDNAVAVIRLGKYAAEAGKEKASVIAGFIPTEAYPGGLSVDNNTLFVCNLEGRGAGISNKEIAAANTRLAAPATRKINYMKGLPDGADDITAYNSHHQQASVSVIKLPSENILKDYTARTRELNFTYRESLAKLAPRPHISPVPVPERIGEPSVFQHVVYIIKENRTYDQVLGDMSEGKGAKQLCIFGDSITPNQHQLARNFTLLDNYYASGKCSAEGHQWTDAGMVTDYVEKNVRAWFRSYPHVQNDALVYDRNGFIWNQAADQGKTVRIYGEASVPVLDSLLSSQQIYDNYKRGISLAFHNTSTIARVRPLLSPGYPGSDDLTITDQIRADAFIAELNQAEAASGDSFPELSVMALSDDHTEGTRPGLPTPRAMVADNDLALGRIVAAISKSRFWKNTVIFVTEDDSQAGWDHISAYRTTGFVISPYSYLHHAIAKNYNQVSMLRTIEQILGVPPMNIMDATAEPMTECFQTAPVLKSYSYLPNLISINERNPGLSSLKGKALHFAKASLRPEFDHVDGGADQLLNQIVWFSVKGNRPYPFKLSGKDDDDDDKK